MFLANKSGYRYNLPSAERYQSPFLPAIQIQPFLFRLLIGEKWLEYLGPYLVTGVIHVEHVVGVESDDRIALFVKKSVG